MAKLRLILLVLILTSTGIVFGLQERILVSDIPTYMFEEHRFSGLIVIGENASAADGLSALAISSALKQEAMNHEAQYWKIHDSPTFDSLGNFPQGPVRIDRTVIDEWTVYDSYDLILVGGPCANRISRSLLNVSMESCANDFEAGKSRLRIIDLKNGHIALLVAGFDEQDTDKAAYVFSHWNDFSLEGSDIEISGDSTETLSVQII